MALPDVCVLGMQGRTAGALAGQHLVAVVIAAVGQHREFLASGRIQRLLPHRGQLRPVAADIGDLVRDDQMVLGIDGHLNIVADDAGALAAGRHRPGVGIGQGNLFVGRGFDLSVHLLEGLHLPPQALDLLLEAHCLGLGDIIVLPIRTVERRQVARDAGLHLLDAFGDLGHREVLVAVVDGLELAPVERHDSSREQVEMAAQARRTGRRQRGSPVRCRDESRRSS